MTPTRIFLTVSLSLLALYGCDKPTNSTKDLPKDHLGRVLHPDDSVKMTDTTFACTSPVTLLDAMEALNKGETEEFSKIVNDYPECISASNFGKQHWTVMRVEKSVVSIGTPKVADWEDFCAIDKSMGNDIDGYHRCPTDSEWWIPASWLEVQKSSSSSK